MLRLIFYAILIYLGYRLLQMIFKTSAPRKPEVQGKPQGTKPLDLSDADVEDAKFKDIKED